MAIELQTKVVVVCRSEGYEDHYGERGTVVKLEQYPEDDLPSITVLLDNGDVLPDLIDDDLKVVG